MLEHQKLLWPLMTGGGQRVLADIVASAPVVIAAFVSFAAIGSAEE
jgi:hypothetical protein